jgi:hypothetical protein
VPLIALAWSQPSAGNIVGTVVLAVGLSCIWAAGWWTKVVVSERGVYIDNVFFQHVIPWKAFVDFAIDSGLVATLSDRTSVGVVSFGGSLAGAVTQYRGLSKRRDVLAEACKKYRAAGKDTAGRYRPSSQNPLASAARVCPPTRRDSHRDRRLSECALINGWPAQSRRRIRSVEAWPSRR